METNKNNFIVLTDEEMMNIDGAGAWYSIYDGEFPPPPYMSEFYSPISMAARMNAWAHGIRVG
ncbi:hypothetical protein [Streptococcus himalayensis]|uniref:Bacteriocin n=1 Tax=Streptococcus himalayensis TaxID=1888195 RepID=A0A917A4G0_9STRE|nr:hypothetical protein [Streptococcus himalayensis]GGE24567.1 hypothetical protein GCM10011510_02080 [Streptococcus himalayensis]